MVTLVTGARGFLGAAMVRLLVEKGDTVVAIDQTPAARDPAWPVDRVSALTEDVQHAAGLRAIVRQHRIGRIVHLAYILPPRSEAAPADAVRVNCGGTAAVFEAAAAEGIRRVVWASSMSVYGPSAAYPSQPLDEAAQTKPTGFYGATKVLAEHLGESYRALGLDTVALRFNLVYGPGRTRGLGPFIAWARDLIERAALGLPAQVPSADHEVDWLYVRDAALALWLALEADERLAPVYNVLGERATARRVAGILRDLMPTAAIELQEGTLGDAQLPPRFDGTLAAHDLRYRPAFSLANGVLDYVDTVRAAKGLPALGPRLDAGERHHAE